MRRYAENIKKVVEKRSEDGRGNLELSSLRKEEFWILRANNVSLCFYAAGSGS